jgi:hypothetical protein
MAGSFRRRGSGSWQLGLNVEMRSSGVPRTRASRCMHWLPAPARHLWAPRFCGYTGDRKPQMSQIVSYTSGVRPPVGCVTGLIAIAIIAISDIRAAVPIRLASR